MAIERRIYKVRQNRHTMIQGGKVELGDGRNLVYGFASDIDKECLSRVGMFCKDKNHQILDNSLGYWALGRWNATTVYNTYPEEAGPLCGSTSFLPILINQKEGVLPEGEKVLSLAEFGAAFNSNTDFFKDTYQNLGLILEDERINDPRKDGMSSSDTYLEWVLSTQLSERGFKARPKSPVVVSLSDLRLRRDTDSAYNFVLDLAENAKPIQGENVGQAYGKNAETRRFNIYDAQGIPIPDKDGRFKMKHRGQMKHRAPKNNSFGISIVQSVNQVPTTTAGNLIYSDKTGRVAVGKLEEKTQN